MRDSCLRLLWPNTLYVLIRINLLDSASISLFGSKASQNQQGFFCFVSFFCFSNLAEMEISIPRFCNDCKQESGFNIVGP